MKKKILYKLLILGCAAILCCANSLYAQNKNTSISSSIVDEAGQPISGVKIYAPKGVSTETNDAGEFNITVSPGASLILEMDGFDSKIINMSELAEKITLEKSAFLASAKDEVKMGISTQYKRNMVGAASTINPADHQTYDNTQWVRDYIQGLLLGVKGSSNIRGLGNALFVIDGVIGRDPNILNMDEVEQITVLKDANSVALYGAQAKNGVIVINTKRGKVNQKTTKVNVRYGMKAPISLPKFLGSAEYMELYNEARMNDGLEAYYDAESIENHRLGENPYRYPDLDLYSDEYLRPMAQTADVTTEFSGGNEKTQYYVNMGWNYNESLVKLNPEANAGSNRFNVRGNIDFKVNDFIKSSIDAVAIISSDKSAQTNLLNIGATLKPNAYAPLLPVSMIDTAMNSLLAGQVNAAGIYDGMLLGGSQIYQSNAPIANIIAGGYRNTMFRSTQFNNSIDFDLDMITEGLSAKTYLSFDFYDAYNLTVNNKFRVYEPIWDMDKIIGLTPYGDVDQKDLTENVNTNGYISRLAFYGLLNYVKTFNDDHNLNATLLAYTNSTTQNNVLQTDRSSHAALQVSYNYKQKLFADFSGAYVHSIKLPEGNRGGFAPTGGLAYILSEEDFIKDIDAVNFLKLKASGGIIKSDLGINQYYLYADSYSDGSWYNWNDGASQNRAKDAAQGENKNMTFEERVDFNLGVESYLFNSLWFEFNYFKSTINNQLTRLNTKYPSFYDVFKPYDNYDKDAYSGFELGMEYSKQINDFSINVGGNLLFDQSEVINRDEVYENDYEYRTGKPTNAIFGLVDEGFYTESDFTTDADGSYILGDNLPVPAYGAVQPGDIKYVDQNGDGVVNNNDRIHIGQYSNPWSYGLNLKLKYKGLSLYVLGIGQFGGNSNRSGDYYWVDGNDKYSEVVLDRWTPATASTATYPRLSSKTNNNNYRTSTFWMYDDNSFDIKRAQLTYEFSKNFCEKIKMKNLSVNVTGINLIRFGENKDIQQLNTSGNPQYRYFTLGLRTSF